MTYYALNYIKAFLFKSKGAHGMVWCEVSLSHFILHLVYFSLPLNNEGNILALFQLLERSDDAPGQLRILGMLDLRVTCFLVFQEMMAVA